VQSKEPVSILIIGENPNDRWVGCKAYVSSEKGLFQMEWTGGWLGGLDRLKKGGVDRICLARRCDWAETPTMSAGFELMTQGFL